jgi:Zn-finger nucleic acid-binding protein
MACGPGGCGGGGGGPSWLETRLLGSLILSSTLVLGVLWIEGHRVLAVSLVSVPVALIVFGSFLSACLDRACLSVLAWWRASRFARKAGKLYCPECADELRDAPAGGPAARRECPRCLGAWCASSEMQTRLSQYEATQAVWRSHPAEDVRVVSLCPGCAAPLDFGAWTGFPTVARCDSCRGHWLPRTTVVWFELNPAHADRRF